MTDEMPKLDAPAPEEAKKKRGRPAGSKNKKSTVPPEARENVLNPAQIDSPQHAFSDEEAGKTFAGVFMVASLGLGSHWRLLPYEAQELGTYLGPIFRRYPDMVGRYADLLMCGPAIASVLVPRIGIEAMIRNGSVKREEGRDALMQVLALNIAATEKSKKELAKEGAVILERLESQPAPIEAAQ